MRTAKPAPSPIYWAATALWYLTVLVAVAAGILAQIAVDQNNGIAGSATFLAGLLACGLSYLLGCIRNGLKTKPTV